MFLMGRHPTATGNKDKKLVWLEITEKLNKLGPNKTTKQWQKVISLKKTFLVFINFFFFNFIIKVLARLERQDKKQSETHSSAPK